MNVHFFEEYPSHETLEKAALIDWECVVFLAAESLSEYHEARAVLSQYNQSLTAGYWPKFSDQDWLSPFIRPSELSRLEGELDGFSEPVLFDLELPFLHKRAFARWALFFFANKKRIRRLVARTEDAWCAEYPPARWWPERLLRALGVIADGGRRLPMFYSSMMSGAVRSHVRERLVERLPDALALGTIDTGVLGDEPELSADALRRDLELCGSLGVEDVVVYRLGGLDGEYAQLLSRYV